MFILREGKIVVSTVFKCIHGIVTTYLTDMFQLRDFLYQPVISTG